MNFSNRKARVDRILFKWRKHYKRHRREEPQIQECDLCHKEFAIRDLEFNGTQFLCAKCK